jgi:hypothetical protein
MFEKLGGGGTLPSLPEYEPAASHGDLVRANVFEFRTRVMWAVHVSSSVAAAQESRILCCSGTEIMFRGSQHGNVDN